MSWQAYVDTNLLGTGKISKAAILGLQGGVWASSPGYTITPEEQKAIIAGFTNHAGVQASGIRLAGTKFFALQVGDRTIQVKKGGDGAVLVKTSKAVLVAEYAAPVQAPEMTPTVESLADYLISVGY